MHGFDHKGIEGKSISIQLIGFPHTILYYTTIDRQRTYAIGFDVSTVLKGDNNNRNLIGSDYTLYKKDAER